MNEVIRVDGSGRELVDGRALLLPLPQLPGVRVREARLGPPEGGDLAFIDALQRKHAKAVGWMPTKQLEGHIARGHVVVAVEEDASYGAAPRCESGADRAHPHPSPLPEAEGARIGYCIGVDRYFKREDTGIIYQMNVTPGRQRGLVGATLLKAMFERWPYGVRLCCCWCAQDLAANHYWEAMGFVALAFRAGSRKRDRVHIFWQKKVRAGDEGVAYWYPSQTGAGALKEDRIVLPIPPGTRWSDAKPRVLPEVAGLLEAAAEERKALEAPARQAARALRKQEKAARAAREARAARPVGAHAGGLWFGGAGGGPDAARGDGAGEQVKEKAKEKAKPAKNDPRLVAAARELRDRWLEQVAREPGLIESQGKYDVVREVGAESVGVGLSVDVPVRLLDAA